MLGGIKKMFFRSLTFALAMSVWEFVIKPYIFPNGINDLRLFFLIYFIVSVSAYIIVRGVVR